jgi:transposase-like protein
MIQKMTGSRPLSANALSREVGISQSTLSRWLRDAARTPRSHVARNMKEKGEILIAKRPVDWSPEEKFNLVLEASSIPEGELGAFLRRKGVHEAQLAEWRQMMLSALKTAKAQPSAQKTSESRRIRQLESELNRKEKALAETAALLVLQKKVQILWGDEENPTPGKNGK